MRDVKIWTLGSGSNCKTQTVDFCRTCIKPLKNKLVGVGCSAGKKKSLSEDMLPVPSHYSFYLTLPKVWGQAWLRHYQPFSSKYLFRKLYKYKYQNSLHMMSLRPWQSVWVFFFFLFLCDAWVHLLRPVSPTVTGTGTLSSCASSVFFPEPHSTLGWVKYFPIPILMVSKASKGMH